jgi:hypothetical protein
MSEVGAVAHLRGFLLATTPNGASRGGEQAVHTHWHHYFLERINAHE